MSINWGLLACVPQLRAFFSSFLKPINIAPGLQGHNVTEDQEHWRESVAEIAVNRQDGDSIVFLPLPDTRNGQGFNLYNEAPLARDWQAPSNHR
jgi:hypothetical protein